LRVATDTGTIIAVDGSHLAVRLDGRRPRTINFDAASFDKFRHGYAGTIYKGQGETLDQTYLYHSDHWRAAPSYVALTRHREKTELFVARNTTRNIGQLARQIGRPDERRAAAQFHLAAGQEIGPVRPMTAPEILAQLAGGGFARRTERMEREGRQSARRPVSDNLDIDKGPTPPARAETPYSRWGDGETPRIRAGRRLRP
jgi:hypothetical protein